MYKLLSQYLTYMATNYKKASKRVHHYIGPVATDFQFSLCNLAHLAFQIANVQREISSESLQKNYCSRLIKKVQQSLALWKQNLKRCITFFPSYQIRNDSNKCSHYCSPSNDFFALVAAQ